MMIRILLTLLLVTIAVRASDPIPAPTMDASAPVSQPHVTAELIPDYHAIKEGGPFDVALHLHADPGWHTYWINPGDAGLATSITWTLPPGFTAGPIQWPTPEKHNMGPLITFGYGGDVYLLTTITPPADNHGWMPSGEIKAKARWLVCQEECIPGKAELSFPLERAYSNHPQGYDELRAKFFAEARARLPVENTRWEVKANYEPKGGLSGPGEEVLAIWFKSKQEGMTSKLGNIYFYPEQGNVIKADTDSTTDHPDPNNFFLALTLQQNGEKPEKMSGVLVSDQPLIGAAKSLHISEFATNSSEFSMTGASLSGRPDNSPPQAANDQVRLTPPSQGPTTSALEPQVQAPPLQLIAVLGAAFVGGLILNLMPCVLPVLSLKVFSLMKHAGENHRAAWIQGAAFTAGVVLSFWLLAGLLLVLRAAGNQLGWGFQMQSPGFVLALILLFFLLALNLFGVFELGASLVGLDAKATGHLGGLASSFGNGALATLAATPCTAPFMGSSLGFAAQQPPFVALLIFTCLALGMASPYLLLTIFPGALRFVPKPGAWMEAFKQFMGFLLMGSVIYLVYVFGALVGEAQVPWLLFVLLIAGLAAWVYGRWSVPTRSTSTRVVAFLIALALLGYAINWGVMLAKATPDVASVTSDGWQPWTQTAVDQALAEGRPVFVDFTAAWCLSCKVNEQVALGTVGVKKAFADKNVALFRADWTHADPDISQALQKFNRDGVPLYLLYSPKSKDAPQILPEVLTPGLVQDALGKL